MTHDHAGRIARLRARLTEGPADTMLITDLINVRYLCGFTGSNGALLVLPDAAVLLTDGRYLEQAAGETTDVEIIDGRDGVTAGLRLADRRGADAVVIEAEAVNLAQFARMEPVGPTLVPESGIVEQLRRHKDAGELALLRRACQIIDDAIRALMPQIRPGLTEREIALTLDRTVCELGGDAPAFETIVASGPNSAIPHHSPTLREVRAGDLLKIDAGALVDGYHSDTTRTFVAGAEPTAEQLDLHAAVAAAAAAARATVAPGTTGRQADDAARAELIRAGLGDRYPHGLGHGVGLRIHEAPMLGAVSTDTIESADVLTIEPGAYVPGFGGVRIEDTLAVTDAGSESLTTLARDLIRLA